MPPTSPYTQPRLAYTAGSFDGIARVVSSWILLLVSVAYAALLFGVAWWGDRRPMYPDRPWLRPVVYSLALAVYCSSWTFYGAVGTAVRNGVGYLPIYIGPLLLLLFGWRIIERLALIARSQNVVSIADFISSRFGRSRRLAGRRSASPPPPPGCNPRCWPSPRRGRSRHGRSPSPPSRHQAQLPVARRRARHRAAVAFDQRSAQLDQRVGLGPEESGRMDQLLQLGPVGGRVGGAFDIDTRDRVDDAARLVGVQAVAERRSVGLVLGRTRTPPAALWEAARLVRAQAAALVESGAWPDARLADG